MSKYTSNSQHIAERKRRRQVEKWRKPIIYAGWLAALSLALWLIGVHWIVAVYGPSYFYTVGYLIHDSVESCDSRCGDGFAAGILAMGWPIFWIVWIRHEMRRAKPCSY